MSMENFLALTETPLMKGQNNRLQAMKCFETSPQEEFRKTFERTLLAPGLLWILFTEKSNSTVYPWLLGTL